MALAGTPARYNKSFSVIRQYGPTFATAHGGIQYDCGASGGGLPKFFYSVLFIINTKLRILITFFTFSFFLLIFLYKFPTLSN
jgi:hypothetical protein